LKDSLPPEEDPESPKRCRLQIRLFFGKRVTRIFSLDNTLKALFDFIESSGMMDEGNMKYEVVALYPRRTWCVEQNDQDKTLVEVGIKDNDTLYVQEYNTNNT